MKKTRLEFYSSIFTRIALYKDICAFFFKFDFQISFSGNFGYATGVFYSEMSHTHGYFRLTKSCSARFFALYMYCADGRAILFLRIAKIKKISPVVSGLIFHRYLHNKQNITCPLVDTNLIFSC